ncbi:MAG: hypothetical protein LKM30_04185 [Bacilli bacterium]|jgi:hypothetical protein|nr:hypothetical protein [Bacilli bacterium]
MVIDTEMPEEWKNQTDLEETLDHIQSLYQSLFINNSQEFRYVGFSSAKQKEEYLSLIKDARSKILSLLPKDWVFIDDVKEGKD